MTIAIDASFIHERATGVGVFAHSLVQAMLEVDVTGQLRVFTSSPDLIARFPERVYRTSHHLTPASGISGHLTRWAWQQTVLPRKLRRIRAKLLYSVVPEGILTGHLPSVLTLYDLLPLRYPRIYGRMKYHFRLNVPRLLCRARAVVVTSKHTRAEVHEVFGVPMQRIHVVYGAYDPALFYPGSSGGAESPSRGKDFFFYVGHTRPYKNLERTLQAYAQLSRRDIEFWIGGAYDTRFRPPLEKMIQELGITSRVRFLGYLSSRSLRDMYTNAVALVFPSLHEGFGLPVLEAMASGCPVLAARATALPEVCGNAALFVDPRSVTSIRDGLRWLVRDRSLRDDLRRRGLERVKRFSWNQAAREVLFVLRTAASEEPSLSP